MQMERNADRTRIERSLDSKIIRIDSQGGILLSESWDPWMQTGEGSGSDEDAEPREADATGARRSLSVPFPRRSAEVEHKRAPKLRSGRTWRSS